MTKNGLRRFNDDNNNRYNDNHISNFKGFYNSLIVFITTCISELLTLIRAIGGEAVCLLECAKMDLLAGLAFPVQAD